MAIKLQSSSFISSSSNPCLSHRPVRVHFFCNKMLDLKHILHGYGYPRYRNHLRCNILLYEKLNHGHRWWESKKCSPTCCKVRRDGPPASSDDGIAVNGAPQTSSSSDMEEFRVKLNQSLQSEDYSDGLVQSLHDAARVFELAIKEQSSLSKISWFSTAWLGVDKNAWVKALSYQASIYSLLQAASEISSRGDGRDRDINVFVQRSLLRQSAPLESLIKEEFSSKQPEAYEWFWSEQLPVVVTTFVNHLERDPRFTPATTVSGGGLSSGLGNACDISLLMLALTCIAAITKLGPAKVSCSQFFSMIPDVIGRLMDMLVDFIPIRQTYNHMKEIGLRREFLVHFGPRAASCRVKNDRDTEEVSFWVELIQKQLLQAIDREKIWSRLTTCESIEVLEKDLAIFGFFIALGRGTKAYLFANGFDVIDDPIEGVIRYLIGGSVLYYPQLSSISSYQLYVEVVCEELEWLPFYQGDIGTLKQSRAHKNKPGGPPNRKAIPEVLDVCSYWMQSFIKYSKWLENPSNIKAARFLSRGHNILEQCMEKLGMLKSEMEDNISKAPGERSRSITRSSTTRGIDSFDKALESVDEALKRLEELLQEAHVSSSNSGKEHLKAACSDLERIRKLKKEAEFLEASFRAKAASFQQGDDQVYSGPSFSKQGQHTQRNGTSAKRTKGRSPTDGNPADRIFSKPRGLWSILVNDSSGKIEPRSSMLDQNEEECSGQTMAANICDAESESNEIHRFEILRNELIELEKRVQRNSSQSDDEDFSFGVDPTSYGAEGKGVGLVQVHKKESVIGKSIHKLKEASTDVWQGTQLLAIDVGAALELLRRSLTGDELTDKEKQALRRTVTDLASVVPIGILMLLPVTAVGHAAMLAAIQRYVPALIPSTYGPERLDLLRQLDKLKEMDDINPEENAEGSTVGGSSANNL
ncbi:Letm1-like protein [Thalictrum thalictroides]|uniref:Letm1-like protein n=1 Tax=Thalictrum thalictroides TaxID=46969 RepID=A0A7J6XFQ0_THATH|nr:Letm1-like protein [Thalictrum thalictroides]